MKIKSLRNFIITLLIIFAFTPVILLSSCKIEEVNLESMELIEGAPTEFVIGEFDYSKYSFLVKYKDGEEKTIVLTEDMLSSEDYLKTYKDGTHVLTARYLNMTCEFTVEAKRFTFPSDIKLQDSVVTYDGLEHGLEVVGAIPEGTTITFPDGNSYVNANEKGYTVNAILVNSMYVTASISGNLIINRAEYDVSKLEFNDAEYTYDGTQKSISVIGDDKNELEITYSIGKAETNSMINASDEPYVVTAHFDAGGNYLPIDDMKANLTINKATYDMTGVEFNNKTYTYDGNFKTVTVGNLNKLPKGVTVQYTNNVQKLAGQYNATASFSGDSTNYEPIPDLYAVLTIEKATVNLSTIALENESFEYNKSPHFVSYIGSLPNGVTFSKYEYYEIDEDDNEIQKIDAIIDVGRYHVKALFVYNDKLNYNDVDPLVCTVEIVKADITDAIFEDASIEYDGFSHSIYVSNLPDGVNVQYTNNAQKEVGTYTIGATFSFVPGSTADKNYNELSTMTATLCITKASMGSNFEDVSLEYSGDTYKYKVSDYSGANDTYLGKEIVIMCGDEEINSTKMYEYLPEGVSIYYTVYNSTTRTESPFDGSINPGETFLYVNYYTESLEVANNCYSHYNVNTPTLTTATIDGETKNIYKLARKYLIFNITKKEYIPTFVNQKSVYMGFDIAVTIDVTNDTDPSGKYPNLSFASGYETTGGVYENNVQVEAGIYKGSVSIKLSDEASQYYTVSDNYEFIYAILDESGQTVYNPDIDDIIYEDYVTTKNEYKINNDIYIPQGINIDYVYATNITKPGSYAVKVVVSFEDDNNDDVFSYGDAAKYYYRLSKATYTESNGVYSRIITYTINHIQYVPEFVSEYEYEGTAIIPEAIDLPSWIEVTYYDGDKEVKYQKIEETDYIISKPSTYHLTAKLTIKDKTMEEYYVVDENGYNFDITVKKGHYSDYIILGEKVKYDGKLHNVSIQEGTLPEGFTYITSLGEGRSEVGVYKDVIIYFSGSNDYYEQLDNVKLNMTIENNAVSLGNLEAYVKTSGIKSIKQFTTLKEILGSYVDLTGADVTWTVDYYKNNVIYSSQYANRHGSSDNSDDFNFTESTTDDEYVVCSFTINLRNGYVFDNDEQNTTYGGNLTFSITQTKKVAIGDLVQISDYNQIHISQGTILDVLINSYVPEDLNGSFEIESWTADYYYALNEYPADYLKAHGSSETYINETTNNKFVFELNTWGLRNCRVTYTLKVLGDYCFYIDGQSYQTYSSSFECLVDQDVTVVDDYFIKNATSNNEFDAQRYWTLDKYLSILIDTNLVNVSTKLYDSNDAEILPDDTGKIKLDTNVENSKIDLVISLNDDSLSFENSETREYKLTKADLILDDPHYLDFDTAFNIAFNIKNYHLELEQYVQPGKNVASTPAMIDCVENTNYKYILVYPDGTTMIGINETSISLSKTTSGDEEVICHWTFSPKDGNYVIDPVTKERIEVLKFDLYAKIIPVEIIETTELSEYANETQYVEQYESIVDELTEYIENIKTITGDELKYKWSISYYDGTTKLDICDPVTDSTDFVGLYKLTEESELKEWLFKESTSENEYVILTLELSTDQNSGYIFDIIEKEYKIVVRYEVKEREYFEEPKLESLNNNTENDNKPFSVRQNTTLQSFLNEKSLNSNLTLSRWTITYNKNETEVKKIGSAVNIFRFDELITYHVILDFETADGTCLLLNGKYYDTYTIEFDVKGIPVISTTLKISSTKIVDEAIYLGKADLYKNEYINASFEQYFNNFNAIDTIEYTIGLDANYSPYIDDLGNTTPGTYKYFFKITPKMSNDDAIYEIIDNNNEVVAKDVVVLVLLEVEISEPEEINLADYYDKWLDCKFKTGVALSTYLTYGIADKADIVSVKVDDNEITESEWNDVDYLGSLSKDSCLIDFTLKAKRDYEFNTDEYTLELSFTREIVTETTSIDDWLTNNTTEDCLLRTYYKYNNCLIAAYKNVEALEYPSTEFDVSYQITKYKDSGLVDNRYDRTSCDEDITDIINIMKVSSFVVYKLDYEVTMTDYWYSPDGIWETNKYNGIVYIYVVPSQSASYVSDVENSKSRYTEYGYYTPDTDITTFINTTISGRPKASVKIYNYNTDPSTPSNVTEYSLGTYTYKSVDTYFFQEPSFVCNFEEGTRFYSWNIQNQYLVELTYPKSDYPYYFGWVVAIY